MLFAECALFAVDGTFGVPLGMAEFLDGQQACYFDSQGWAFLEFGRIWHELLFAGFGLWVLLRF